MSSTVVVVGSVNMDLVVRAPRIPKEGESLIGSEFKMVPGGKGANQAVAAARLGSTTYFVGRVGNDMFGSHLRQNLMSCGVNTDYLLSPNVVGEPLAGSRKAGGDKPLPYAEDTGPSGIAMIVLNERGQNSIVVAPGANGKCRPADLDAATALFRTADFLLLQLEIPLDTVEAALDKARSAGVKSILDAGPAQDLPERIVRKADIISPNETETQALTGMDVTDVASARDAARALLNRGAQTVVLKLGEQGAFVATRDLEQHVPGFRVEVVDTTAAGDAFTAALAVSLAEGHDLIEAVRFANAAGALAVTQFGAQPSMPTRDAVDRFIAERSKS